MVNVIPGRDKPTRMNSKNMESLQTGEIIR